MKQATLFKEDLELDELNENSAELDRRRRELAEAQRRIAEERAEQERTIPPLEEIQVRIQRRKHEETVSRGEITNIRRDQNRSLMMLFLLVAATASLIWWGMRLMQGG
jgi:hypothetical protein